MSYYSEITDAKLGTSIIIKKDSTNKNAQGDTKNLEASRRNNKESRTRPLHGLV